MLRKESLLTVPFVSGWRKLTVGKYRDRVSGSYSLYGFSSTPFGDLSDRTLNGKSIAKLYSYDGSSRYTYLGFSNYESLPERTLYLKRKDKDTIALSYRHDEGIYYANFNVYYFTEEDVDKTIDIYLGITPPP